MFGLIIDSIATRKDEIFSEKIHPLTVLMGFKAIGKNLDANFKPKASLKVLTDNIIPDYLKMLLKQN